MTAIETTGVIGNPETRTYQASAANMKRGVAVIQGASDLLVAVAGANAIVLGFQNEDTVNIGDPVAVTMEGEAVAIIGAAVAAGQALTTDANGHMVPATPGQNVSAIAVSSGAVALDFITVRVVRFVAAQLVGAPAAANSAGVAGQIAYDATHFYVCIAVNSWVKATFAAW
jgi:hypothetical protein